MKETLSQISCKKAAQLLSESFEHKLSLSKKIALQTHLVVCKTCVYCMRQIKGLRAIFKNYDKAVSKLPPPACCCLSDKAKKKMKNSLSQQCKKQLNLSEDRL